MKRMFEFSCKCGNLFEKYIDDKERVSRCPECDAMAQRIVSMPRISLEGITGSFPGAYDSWERKRAEKLKQERKKASQDE